LDFRGCWLLWLMLTTVSRTLHDDALILQYIMACVCKTLVKMIDYLTHFTPYSCNVNHTYSFSFGECLRFVCHRQCVAHIALYLHSMALLLAICTVHAWEPDCVPSFVLSAPSGGNKEGLFSTSSSSRECVPLWCGPVMMQHSIQVTQCI